MSMKKLIELSLIAILCLCLCCGCGAKATEETSHSFYGLVVWGNENSIAVTPLEGMTERKASDIFIIPQETYMGMLRGEIVCVEYDGNINETYPASIDGVVSISPYEGEEYTFTKEFYSDARNRYFETLIHPEYPYSEEAFAEFLSGVSENRPVKYALYEFTDEGDPIFYYLDYVTDSEIGSYFHIINDTSYDRWSAEPGMHDMNLKYLFEDEYGNICFGDCASVDAYRSVINYDSYDCAYSFFMPLKAGKLPADWHREAEEPVVIINAPATVAVGIDTLNQPNVITVNNHGKKSQIDLSGYDNYLARGVYFRADDKFTVVSEGSEGSKYLIIDYAISADEIKEERNYLSPKLPSPFSQEETEVAPIASASGDVPYVIRSVPLSCVL